MANDTFTELMKQRGRKAELAEKLGVDRSMITRWLEKRVPAERVLDVERFTGIDRTLIRPDIYPCPSQEETAA